MDPQVPLAVQVIQACQVFQEAKVSVDLQALPLQVYQAQKVNGDQWALPAWLDHQEDLVMMAGLARMDFLDPRASRE